jgi:predicted transcriptional regulator
LVEIKEPMLSTVLSGTPGQIQNLIKNVEDGLFSRFMFYSLELKLEWKDVFRDNSGYDFEEFFDLYAMDIKGIYDLLMPKEKIEFKVTKEQGKKFNKLFDEWQDKYFDRQGEQIIASVRRCGVIAFRIAMILSTLRIIDDGVVPDAHQGITCGDDDFNNAIDITNVLLEHTEKVFCQLPKKTVNNTQKREITFLNALPTEFNRKKYVEIAGQSRIPDNTAQKYIRKFVKEGVIKKKGHDSYEKLKP